MNLSVTIDLTSWGQGKSDAAALNAFRQAVTFLRKPRNWRLSEYAATKAHAQQALSELERQAMNAAAFTLSVFDWSVLLGELARLCLADAGARAPESTFALYDTIRAGLVRDEQAARVLAAAERCDRLRRRINRTRRRLKALERQLHDKQGPHICG